MFRYSLRTLIALVSLAAVGCAALMNARGWIASTAWTVALVTLALATVAAVLGTPDRRGFWIGFAIVGWTYLLVAMGPMDAGFKGTLWTTVILQKAASTFPPSIVTAQQPFYTSSTLAYSDPTGSTYVAPQPMNWPSAPQVLSLTGTQPAMAQVTVQYVDESFAQAFQRIGQALWTLLFAFIGGLFGAFIVARNNRPAAALQAMPAKS